MPEQLLFSSDHLPQHLSEAAKFNLWRDIYIGEIAALDISVSDRLPFHAEMQAVGLGPLLLTRMTGSITGMARTASHVASEGSGDYCLLINKGATAMGGTFRQKQTTIASGAAALQTFGEPLSLSAGDSNAWINLIVPRDLVAHALPDIDARLAIEIGADNEALRLLVDYCRMLETRAPLTSPELVDHTTNTIIDLVGLATGAKGEAADMAGLRGLRAARLAAILGKIQAGFADPHISALGVALSLGLSLRYVHSLLQETGIGFSERVLELRLQKAKLQLADRRFDHLRISEIAYAAGFGDVSYFNRSFRRRFGITPSAAR
ncbi:MAG: helix-turn-helix protein [Hyphomicrobiales bacterium]|nr:helix-turn-helix protein [Hyphomicrobiales bacterium]